MAKRLDDNGLLYFWQSLKTKLGTKVDKVEGKGLSTNDYTTSEKDKLSGIASGADVSPVISTDISSDSTSDTKTASPKAVKTYVDNAIPTVPTISTDIEADALSDTKTTSPKAVKTYVDTKTGATYKAGGSRAFANLPSPSSTYEGYVYNVTDAFTTDARFIEGSGHDYPAGTNVVIVDTGSSVYKFDVMSGFVDLSLYWAKSELVAITNAEIDTIMEQ